MRLIILVALFGLSCTTVDKAHWEECSWACAPRKVAEACESILGDDMCACDDGEVIDLGTE